MLSLASIYEKPRRDPATWLMTPPHTVDVEKARQLREMAAPLPDEEEPA